MSQPLATVSASVPARTSDLSAEEPWPGLASYSEEDTAYFAARDAERDELLERVLQHRLTVLYGLSGLGKSSLVQAGLFPELRARQCLPVYVRLNFAAEAPGLVDQVFATIEAAALAAQAKMPARQDAETLWEYVQRQGNAFWSPRNRLLTPVLAFDQFEEIFTLGAFRRADESKAFLEAIADLAEGRAPIAVKARLDRAPPEAFRSFDFSREACRVLLSLREDYLAYLDDLRHLMPTKGNRMRLRPLNGIQAITVVRKPGGGLVTQAVAEEIVAAVASPRQRQRPAEEQEVDPALLSLLCRGLNKRRIDAKAAHISAGTLTEQVRAGILGQFYEEAVGRVSATVRRFVEDKLLLASGQRNSVALEIAHEAGVDDAQIETLVAERLLRREERGGVVYIELTHDVLTEVVRASRDQRREREAREQAEREREQAQREAEKAERRLRKSRRIAIAMAALALVAVGLLWIGIDAFKWVTKYGLPPESMLTLQRFRFGYEPLPDLSEEIPPGSFQMGEQDKQFVERARKETWPFLGFPGGPFDIAKGFHMGRHEVTYDQFDFYVWTEHRAGRRDKKFPTTAKGGRGNRPVVNVKLAEASDYVRWLGKRTGRDCRLPTEAEWEYAARGQKNPALPESAYPWGNEFEPNRANCRNCGSTWDEQSAPVGSFEANGFGLHDTSGNVWEWTCSLWRPTLDPNAKECADADDFQDRVVRGGAWRNGADVVRLAARGSSAPDDRSDDIGLRVLCSSPIDTQRHK